MRSGYEGKISDKGIKLIYFNYAHFEFQMRLFYVSLAEKQNLMEIPPPLTLN